MYRRNGAKFFSTAIYRDCVHEMQGQFIDVWQQKADFPGSNHYVCLRGNQPVEDYFSILRSVSHDSTITAGTILSRAQGAVEVAATYAKHPEWKRASSHRGKVGDNMVPKSAGPCNVDDVCIRTCWSNGRAQAESVLLRCHPFLVSLGYGVSSKHMHRCTQ